MAPCFARGTWRLPNILDLAMLDDIGYTINYSGVSQNPIRNGGVQQNTARVTSTSRSRLTSRTMSRQQLRSPSSLYGYCGCVSCMMF